MCHWTLRVSWKPGLCSGFEGSSTTPPCLSFTWLGYDAGWTGAGVFEGQKIRLEGLFPDLHDPILQTIPVGKPATMTDIPPVTFLDNPVDVGEFAGWMSDIPTDLARLFLDMAEVELSPPAPSLLTILVNRPITGRHHIFLIDVYRLRDLAFRTPGTEG